VNSDHWSATAVCAALLSIVCMVVPTAFDIGYGGMMVPLGSAGPTFQTGFWLLFLSAVSASIMAWRTGSRWPLFAVLAVAALALFPSLMLVAACMQGNCL
jgi:hypothetical protein